MGRSSPGANVRSAAARARDRRSAHRMRAQRRARARRPGSDVLHSRGTPSLPRCQQFVPARQDRPPRPPPWKPVPLTLITGPANAAKAGAVLERLRAARPRDPLLVVPTAADVSHYQRELASSNIVFGAEVLTFSRLVREIARRTRLRARPLGWTARDRVVRAAVAGVPLRELAGSAGTPGFADAAGRLFAELERAAGRAGALHRGAAHLGRRRLARDVRGRARRALLRVPPHAGGARAPVAGGLRVGGARRAARRPGRVGPAPGVPLRLRRPHPDRARRRRDAERARGGRRLPRAALRARARRVRRPRGDRRGAAAAGRRGRRTCRSAPSTTPRAPAAPCTTWSARCSSRRPTGGRRTAPSGSSRRAASAPRPSSSAPRCSS